ncbi:hypothetical protein R537_03005 [Salmonella enterica subsp. enterica serovar Rough O:d:1,7]|uniref:Uncharacterized protein n=1 Tax=Salmonella enterica subsp. enterica serovar Rough O:d:1,7 TaxID=1974323 RepID=A0A974KL69_SALET|nr:hypothetical protein [Salmonella enterica]OSD74523.1 hypothetical protein R537_03005 [Salmonella enterica subsp. enterica serovar Rough O:d:1,7]
MSKELTYSVIVTAVSHIPYNDKKTGEPKLMCTMATLADLDVADRTIGRGFIVEDLSIDNNGAVALRLQEELKKAFSLGYDYIHIIPQAKRQARSRGDGKSVYHDYELVGYGNFTSVALADVKQTDNKPTDSKQPVKA